VSRDPAFVRRTVTGVTVELRAQPRARRTALDCAGGALKAQVTAPAEDGKANAAVIELLAEAWRLPKSAFAVTRGATSRDKVLSIAGEPALLAARIRDWARESAERDG
jgi:uncharacterized protein YggU (UPF0235/DUF167 family)